MNLSFHQKALPFPKMVQGIFYPSCNSTSFKWEKISMYVDNMQGNSKPSSWPNISANDPDSGLG